MTTMDVSGHPKHYAGCKETLEYGGIELKFVTFVPFRFSLYRNTILWFMYFTKILFRHQIQTFIMFSTL